MKWTYPELKGKEITLTSQRRTYRFKCTRTQRRNQYNLKLFGFGLEPDHIFLQHSTIKIMGQEYGTYVAYSCEEGSGRTEIETETILTDLCFWVTDDESQD